MRDFVLEIGTEEMPARFLGPALQQLEELARGLLGEKRIGFREVRTAGTPRRMAVYVSGLAESQQPLVKEVKGPALKVAYNAGGEPTPAVLGFARSQGVDVADLVVKPVGPVEYVFARKVEQGRPTAEVLAEICPGLVAGLHFPKPMRWGNLDFRFARPIRWLAALYGDEVIRFSLAGLEAGRTTRGHRFLSPDPIELRDARDYFNVLKEAFVLVDPGERKNLIRIQVDTAAGAAGGRVEDDEELLDEVNNLVEYPTAFTGRFDQSFLRLPKEVLVTVMREHQRYFPVTGPEGKLLPIFIGVRNGVQDHMATVRAGNEKVIRARLADAAFFWDEDLKVPLADRTGSLKKIVWQESLGTVHDKVERITALALFIGDKLGAEDDLGRVLKRAASICKADLVTNMVYEFPELQGVMGREYALKSGEDPAVAQAIFEHYLPRFAGDILPATPAGRVLSLADKFDTLVGCFAVGIQPTGSQDPYALRRQALGIGHIILDGKLVLSLREIAARAYEGYGRKVSLKNGRETVLSELEEFFRQRIRGLLTDRGFAYDIVDAVISADADDILGVVQRVEALDRFRADPAFEAVITAFNRANNLSRKFGGTEVNPRLMHHPAEEELWRAVVEVRREVGELIAVRDYSGALRRAAVLREPVDAFFDAVMVMVEDEGIRDNRLALLKNVALLVSPLADLGRIVVSG
ncbi:MAG: glycine--tRNA ligase subunit beta [Peptococcaceae bacterium]|nr:glycine--tRNA ligase subunit beta [Peptococcaceae bacterium]